MNKVYVELRDLANEFDNIVLEIEPTDNQLGLMWFNALQHNLKYADNNVEKTHMLKGWAEGTKIYNHPGIRDANTLCNEMNWAIDRINIEMHGRYNYPLIKMMWDLELLSDSDKFRQAANEIHHHFELLIGQVWDVSEWWKKEITFKTREAIRWINNVVHQMEHLFKPARAWFVSLNNLDFADVNHTPMHLFPLGQGCYKYFTTKLESLTITDYYCQLGKKHYEVFCDDDDVIDRKNISGTRYVSGEFILQLRDGDYKSNFNNWLVENDFDPDDITQGYGTGVMGKVVNCKANDIDEIMKRNDIYKISVDDGYKVIDKTFDYTWMDEQEYTINELEGSLALDK